MLNDIPPINDIHVSAYTIPTDYPESDGTIQWDRTTLVLVEIDGGGKSGIGYSYADISAAYFIEKTLKKVIIGADCMDIPAALLSMLAAVRNDGACGIAAMAVSAVDNALWDLKAKLLDLPLALLLGSVRKDLPIYGSGGFTSYPVERLQKQLSGWAAQGIKQVKMKIGREPEHDVYRVRMAKEAIGEKTALFVDANGAYSARQAIEKARQFSDMGINWFEEPVPSYDLKGLNFIREHVPGHMNIVAGEYGYNLPYFQSMLDAAAVDVLQADATRCGGISSFLKAGYVCEAHHMPFSSHCAPALHLHAALSLPAFYTAEYFHDHVRIEAMLFDGVPEPKGGVLYACLEKPGMGLDFKFKDAEKYKVF